MAIKLTCDCGKKLNVKDELEGKRIKCPDCEASLLVENGDSDSGHSKTSMKKKGARANGEKKGGMMLYLILGVGVLGLGFCCLGGSGVGAWWFFFRGPSASGLETKIVGKWVLDTGPVPKISGKGEDIFKLALGEMSIEFKSDGTVIDKTPMTPILQGKWKTVSTKDDVITIEMSQPPIAMKLDIKIVSNDSIKIIPSDTKKELAFKRAP